MNTNKSTDDFITIISQAFYGNRTATEIRPEKLDRFVLGYLDDYPVSKPIDRSIVHLPGSEHVVLIYNKYQEERVIEETKIWLREDNYVAKPLAEIPEMGLRLFSRCIVCRVDENGEPASLQHGDYEVWGKYLAR